MTRDLPLDPDAALAAVAAGWVRTPSHAHPDCVCGRPTGRRSPFVDFAGEPCPELHQWQDCRMHRTEGAT